VRYTIRHIFNTSEDTFWDKVFFDTEYNETLFRKHLGFQQYQLLALDTRPDGSVERKVLGVPNVEIPAAARKFLGDTAGYTELGRFDPKTKRFTADVIPKVGADTIKTKVTMWVEPRGERRIARLCEVDNTVKVFGLGKMLEGFIEKQTRASYDAAAEFTNRWLAEKGL